MSLADLLFLLGIIISIFITFDVIRDFRMCTSFFKQRWMDRKIRKWLKRKDPGENFFTTHPDDKLHVLENDSTAENHEFYGTDSQGNELFVRISRRYSEVADVILSLRLESGETLSLPQHPDTRIANAKNEKIFEAAGLRFECIIPNSRWRIVFAGYLRREIRKTWSSQIIDDDLIFVRFNFIWGAACDPNSWPWSWSPRLIYSALNSAPCRDENLTELLTLNPQGVEQFGSLRGQITIDDRIPTQVVLPGVREKHWGDEKIDCIQNNATLYLSCYDGFVLTLHVKSFIAGRKEIQSGLFRLPCGDVYAIDWSDFSINPQNIPESLLIRISGSGMIFSVILYFIPDKILPLQGGRPLEWTSLHVPFKTTVNGNHGRGSVHLYSYTNLDSNLSHPVEEKPIERIRQKEIHPKQDKFVVQLADTDAQSVAVAGGKGASLALLTSIADETFSVPTGFVITSFAYRHQMNSDPNLGGLLGKISAVCSVCREEMKEDIEKNLQEACQRVTQEIHSMRMREEIRSAVEEFLKKEDVQKMRYAVRSSGISEDGSDASAAGQNETFLGLSNLEDIHQAVLKCWASLYTFQSVQYRRQNTQPIVTEMAVVVQQMIAADASGVLFTQHPSTGNPSHVLITANYGLGESVVSGQVDPDLFIVKRNFHDTQLKLQETQIGKKEFKMEMASNGKVQKIPVDGNSQNRSCLSVKLVEKLAEIGVRLEKFHGNPRDIEWATLDDQIHLLQSRPITSLDAFTDWELAHEFDWPFMSPEDIRTTANVQEIMPGCTSPLSVFTVLKAVDEAFFSTLSHAKTSTLVFNVLSYTTYQLGVEILNLFLRQPEEKIGSFHKVVGMGLLGRDFITEDINRIAKHRRGVIDNWGKIKILIDKTKLILQSSSENDKGNVLVKSFRNVYSPENLKTFSTSMELYEDIKKNLVQLRKILEVQAIVTNAPLLPLAAVMLIMLEGSENYTEDYLNDLAMVLKCSKNVESANIPKILAEIGCTICACGKAEEFQSIPPKDAIACLEKNCHEAYKLFGNFLANHYHRGVKELDLASEMWGMRPEKVIEIIQTSVRFGRIPKAPSGEDSSIDDTIDQLRTPKKRLTKFLLRHLSKLLRKLVVLREISKSNTIAVVHEFRMGFRHLGHLMVTEGRLMDSQLIFYLIPVEIERLLNSRDARLVHKAARRRRLMVQWDKLQFPDISIGVPQPVNHEAPSADGKCTVKGMTVFPGVISGRACSIKSFSDVNELQFGDILITYSTDIAWSPFFPMLSGVVTELGGMSSHGAVVAREYGIPCIVGAHGATNCIQTGDTVTLDAGKGIIFRNE